MALFDGVLAAQNAVTPEFSFRDVAPSRNIAAARVKIQGIRVTGTTAITFNVEYCIPGNDGTKVWHQVDDFSVPAGAGATEIEDQADITPGMLFRVLYETNSTNQIRIIISSASDPFAP